MARIETTAVLRGEDGGFMALMKKAAAAFDGLKGKKAAVELDAVGKAVTKIGQIRLDNLKELQKLTTSTPARGISQDLRREVQALKLSQGEIKGLSREWVKMRGEQEKALAKIGNASVRQQVGAKHEEAMLGRLRERAQRLHDIRSLERSLGGGRSGGLGLPGTVLGVGAGYAARRGFINTARVGAEGAREGARDYLAGLTPEEQDRLRDRSYSLSRRYPSVDATTLHERLRDTSLSMGSVDKGIGVSDAIGRSTVVLQAMKGKEKAIEEGRRFFAALDNLGKNTNVGEITRLVDGWTKALGVEGADLNMGDLLQMARISKSGGASLNEKFLMTVAPALMQDMGSHRLGTALGSEVSQVIGGRATKASKAFQTKAGMRDKKGNFLDGNMMLADPFEYSEKKLMPILAKNKVDPTNNAAVTSFLSKAFSNQTVADLFTKMITQREQYLRKGTQYDKAPGIAAADDLRGKDPFVAAAGATSQFSNSITLLTEGVMPAATAAMNAFASAVGSVNEKARENPEVAKATGRSAAMAGVPAAAWGAGKLLSLTPGEGMIPNLLRMGGGALATGGRMALRAIAPASILDAILSAYKATGDAYGYGVPQGPGSKRYGMAVRQDADERYGAQRPASLPLVGPTPPARPADINTHVDVKADVKGEGSITGQTHVTVKIDDGAVVKALENIQNAVAEMKGAMRLAGNGVGSTGKSGPDASPGAGRGTSGGAPSIKAGPR